MKAYAEQLRATSPATTTAKEYAGGHHILIIDRPAVADAFTRDVSAFVRGRLGA